MGLLTSPGLQTPCTLHAAVQQPVALMLATGCCFLLQGKEKFLAILNKYMEIHGTVYYETQRPPEVPAFVKNHGLLPQHEFQQLLRKAKVGCSPPYGCMGASSCRVGVMLVAMGEHCSFHGCEHPAGL